MPKKAIDKADPFNFDDYRQQVPVFYYKRFQKSLLGGLMFSDIIWTFPFDFGYGFLLRRVSAKWINEVGGGMVPKLLISFFDIVRGATRQNDPYPLEQVATPGYDGVTSVVAPSPVDQDIFGVCLKATPLKNRLIYNLYYKFRDTMSLKLNFDQAPPFYEGDEYIDLLLDGYLIPEKDLAMWK